MKIKTLSIVIPLCIVLSLIDRCRLPSSPPLVWAGQARVPLSPISEPLFVPLYTVPAGAGAGAGAGPVFAPRLLAQSLVTSQQSKIEILLFPGGNYYFPVQCPARGRAGHWSATRDRAALAAISHPAPGHQQMEMKWKTGNLYLPSKYHYYEDLVEN